MESVASRTLFISITDKDLPMREKRSVGFKHALALLSTILGSCSQRTKGFHIVKDSHWSDREERNPDFEGYTA